MWLVPYSKIPVKKTRIFFSVLVNYYQMQL